MQYCLSDPKQRVLWACRGQSANETTSEPGPEVPIEDVGKGYARVLGVRGCQVPGVRVLRACRGQRVSKRSDV